MDTFLSVLVTLFVSQRTIETKYEINIRPDRQEINIQSSQRIQQNANSNVWRGKISIYSATYGGCLYCKKYFDENGQLYYLTASGERLNDSLFTLAANFGSLGDMVSVCNLSNSKCVGAKLNDRGGFDTPEYNNRIADLSVTTAQAIGAITDKSLIEISKVP